MSEIDATIKHKWLDAFGYDAKQPASRWGRDDQETGAALLCVIQIILQKNRDIFNHILSNTEDTTTPEGKAD